MILEDQLRLKLIEVKNERDYRLMLKNEPDALYPPWFFSWVENGQLAAFAWPQTKGNLEYLWRDGIRHIITLCPEKVPDLELSDCKFSWTYIPIEECHAPTIEEIFKFISTVQWCRKYNLPVGVHCRMGLGRTGVMMSIYLIFFHGMEAVQALRNLRYLRPGSVDTPCQEECVLNYKKNAKLANEARLKRITRRPDHLLAYLRPTKEIAYKEGVWGLPRTWWVNSSRMVLKNVHTN